MELKEEISYENEGNRYEVVFETSGGHTFRAI